MKTQTKTVSGFANGTNNLPEICDELRKNGYKELSFFETLRGKKATEKVVVKGYYWRGERADKSKETIVIFYKV